MPSLFRTMWLLAAMVLLFGASGLRAADKPEPPRPASRTTRLIEGWTVRIDDRLLQPSSETGARALKQLESSLALVRAVMPADRLARLQSFGIVLDLTHGNLRSEQYHPSAGWLTAHGYAADLARCVHIPDAAYYTAPGHSREQPWATMHELAHAYHDQVFGFDDPRIAGAWRKYVDSGRGKAVRHINGSTQQHYALTNPMEFFSEMTEAFFGVNDFFPFKRDELKTAEPEVYALMEAIWGEPSRGLGAPDAKTSVQFGARRHDFAVAGHKAFILLPTRPAPDGGRPWVWYAPTLMGHYPDPSHEWLFTRLLARGFAVAGIDVGESFGSPKGRLGFTEFHRFVTDKYALSPRACLLPQSRGGLMLYNWAAEHPESVACIAGIYPVCDLASFPGLAKSCGAYDMTAEDLQRRLPEHNPIDRLAPLARAGIPILHIHGNADKTVPLERNSGELARRYRALGGKMELIVPAGKGHEAVPEFFQSKALLDFLLARGQPDAGRKAP